MEEILRKLQRDASGSKYKAIKESCTWALETLGGLDTVVKIPPHLLSSRGAGSAQEESEDLGSSPGSATYCLCDLGKKKAPMITPLSSAEEVMDSHEGLLGQRSSFTNLLELGTNVKGLL